MKFFSILFSSIFILSGVASAQMWGKAPQAKDTQKEPSSIVQKSSPEAKDNFEQEFEVTEEEKEAIKKKFEEANFHVQDGVIRYNQVFDLPPTDDGSPRGTTGFVSADPEEDDANIYMYINAVRMGRSATLGTTCRVRFITANSLNKKISNLSVKLVWPQNAMANLSFNDVNPNSEVYLDYMLMGPGCYQLDKLPNIIVNRCRVKGMTQQACAEKIRWLSKNR